MLLFGPTDELMNGWRGGCMEGWMNEGVDGLMYEGVDVWRWDEWRVDV